MNFKQAERLIFFYRLRIFLHNVFGHKNIILKNIGPTQPRINIIGETQPPVNLTSDEIAKALGARRMTHEEAMEFFKKHRLSSPWKRRSRPN